MDEHKRPSSSPDAGQPVDSAARDGSIAILEIALAASPTAPARARAELTAWLERNSSTASMIDDARLLLSELVTNSIRHAQITPYQPLRLTASLRATTLRLELHDAGVHGAVTRRPPDNSDGAGGFGLNLVAQLSTAWGVGRDGQGTTVWLELDAARSHHP